jgi:hypothetical protein
MEEARGDATLQSPSRYSAKSGLDVDGASPSVDSLCGLSIDTTPDIRDIFASPERPYSTTMVELHFILFVTRHSFRSLQLYRLTETSCE